MRKILKNQVQKDIGSIDSKMGQQDFQEKRTVTYFYSENDESLVNPARGFYTQIYYKEPERLELIREEGQTLSLVTKRVLSDL